ncbi:hypothetical protein LHA01_18750 [Schleiferilactobacillus harbinensis]|nr:hypothetical protein LHA01_18750 [Schleiferilactobacillus harbinensis]
MKRQSSYRLKSADQFYILLTKNGYCSKQDFAKQNGYNYGSLTHLNSDIIILQYAARIASSLNVSLEQLFIKKN